MYEYPTVGSYWSNVQNAGGSTIPFVLVNPASGPGVAANSDYTTAIGQNTTAGIRSIGYVDANYQGRNYQDVIDDIDRWPQLYPGVTGIFIDRIQEGNAADKCYAASLYNHIKNTRPNDLVVLNPGTHISAAYEPYGDIFLNAENTFAAYQSGWTTQYPGFEDNPAYQNRFWHIIHTTNSSDFNAALNLTRNNNAGWVYITDDVMPNPYHVTPTYWNTELTSVTSLPASQIPNRGKTQLPSGCQDLAAATSESSSTAPKQRTTVSNIQVTNTSSVYDVEPTTKVSFTLPQGVTFSGAGTDWSCTTAGVCDYDATIDADQDAAVLAASFVAGCTYAGGNVSGALTNFAGNSFPLSIAVEKPADCADATGGATSGGSSGTLANTGLSTGIMSASALVVAAAALRIYKLPKHIRYSLAKRSK
jgi:hypothetical protein